MVYKKWITNVLIGGTNITVDYIDGWQVVYSDRAEIIEVLRQVNDQEIRVELGEEIQGVLY